MVAQMTYNSLVSSIETYLDRTDSTLVDMIPQFIRYAETRIGRELRVTAFMKPATNSFTAGTAIVQKPADWLETVSMNVGTGTSNNTRNTIQPRSYDYIRAYWPDPSQTGIPKYYAEYDVDHLIVAPTPASAYPFELVYYALPGGLDSNTQTTVYTSYCPDLFLYACLLETAPYLKDDERIATWQARYDRCLMSELTDDTRLLIDRSVVTMENQVGGRPQ